MQDLRPALLSNLGIKITSLILALAVYAHVYARLEHEAVLSLPLVIEELPEGMTYLGNVPTHIRARLRARGADLLRLRARPPDVVLRLGQPREGMLQRPVTTQDVLLPPETEAIVLGLVNPVTLELSIEPSMIKTLPVAVALTGATAESTILHGGVGVRPDTVTVTGPGSAVGSMDSVFTAAISLEGRAQTFEDRVRLDLPKGVRAGVDEVLVQVPIVPLLERSFGPYPINLSSDLRRTWQCEPESARVRLGGPKELIDGLRGDEGLRLRVLNPDRPAEDEPYPILVQLPAGWRNAIRVESVDPPSVTMLKRRQ